MKKGGSFVLLVSWLNWFHWLAQKKHLLFIQQVDQVIGASSSSIPPGHPTKRFIKPFVYPTN
jgi:hypothetical protein